jgi:hypothetical protein
MSTLTGPSVAPETVPPSVSRNGIGNKKLGVFRSRLFHFAHTGLSKRRAPGLLTVESRYGLTA